MNIPFGANIPHFCKMNYSLGYFLGIYSRLYQSFGIFAKLFPRNNKYQRNCYFFAICDMFSNHEKAYKIWIKQNKIEEIVSRIQILE